MEIVNDSGLMTAKKLTDDFLSETGVSNPAGNPNQRYLWTDAFAVQTCFALSYTFNREEYFGYALKLIDQVHAVLDKHRTDDEREGWISGLSEEEGKHHPTIAGLRIGKKLPESPESKYLDDTEEWVRDGQYFHYLTRWFNALLSAYNETNDEKYALWAVELLNAGSSFILKENSNIRMVWKMNIGLTEPAVEIMGTHDPLEGLISVFRGMLIAPDKQYLLQPMKNDLEIICKRMDWYTSDPLGIGSLLLNTERAAALELIGKKLPENVRAHHLLDVSIAGLNDYSRVKNDSSSDARSRLAFRECGLALGIRTLYGQKENYKKLDIDFNQLKKYLVLADEIEEFWSQEENQFVSAWTNHPEINMVTLASNLLARSCPEMF